MKSTIVFHLTDTAIKCLRVNNTPKKTVTAVDILPVEERGGAPISARLSQWVKEQKISFKDSQVIVLVSRARVLLRYMTLPSHQDHEVRDMIDLQIANHIPFAREEVEVDFVILSKTPDGYSKVMVVIVPQETALRYWKIFEQAHIPVTCMTVTSVGLWLLCQQQPNLPNQLFGIIDLDVNSSEICLCQKEFWLASREIPAGLKSLQQEGNKEFLQQCRLTQESMAKEKIASNIRLLYVVSTSGNVGNLPEELSVALNCPVKEVNLLSGLPVAKNIVWSKHVMEDAVSMAPMVGVAFSAQMPSINLVPQAVRLKQEEQATRRAMVMCGVWAGAFILVVALILGTGFYKKHLQLAHVEASIDESKRQVVPVEKKMAQVRAAEAALRKRLLFSEWMGKVSGLLPPKMLLMNLALTGGNILSLEGVTPNQGDVDRFQQQLSADPMFSDVRLDYVNKRVSAQSAEVNYFKMTCAINYPRGDDEKIK